MKGGSIILTDPVLNLHKFGTYLFYSVKYLPDNRVIALRDIHVK
jgi:hypothetical protein